MSRGTTKFGASGTTLKGVYLKGDPNYKDVAITLLAAMAKSNGDFDALKRAVDSALISIGVVLEWDSWSTLEDILQAKFPEAFM